MNQSKKKSKKPSSKPKKPKENQGSFKYQDNDNKPIKDTEIKTEHFQMEYEKAEFKRRQQRGATYFALIFNTFYWLATLATIRSTRADSGNGFKAAVISYCTILQILFCVMIYFKKFNLILPLYVAVMAEPIFRLFDFNQRLNDQG